MILTLPNAAPPLSTSDFIWDPTRIKPSTITFPAPAEPLPAAGFSHALLVGVSGYARSGKDTVGQALVDRGWWHASFAAKLKAFLYAINPQVVQNGITYRLAGLVDAYGWERAKDEFPEIRKLLQRTGTDAGRKVMWDSLWVDAAMRDVPDWPTVFTDTRFPNEADAIRARGGIIIRVDRPGVGPATDENGHVHESETALDHYDFDYRLDNDGTIEQLQQAVAARVTARWPHLDWALLR